MRWGACRVASLGTPADLGTLLCSRSYLLLQYLLTGPAYAVMLHECGAWSMSVCPCPCSSAAWPCMSVVRGGECVQPWDPHLMMA